MRYFSIDFIARLLGACVFGVGAGILGSQLAEILSGDIETYTVVFSLIGVLVGLVLTPYLTTNPIRRLRKRLVSLPPESLVAITFGTLLGLLAASLFARPLSFLPNVFSQVAPLFFALVFIYLGVSIMLVRQHDLWSLFSNFQPLVGSKSNTPEEDQETYGVVLLDTSVIIDGRITDINKTGFIRSTLLVPNFVLQEMQLIADSTDGLKRNRGKRGLDVLKMLQDESPIPIRITDMDVSEVREVDSKLVALARHLHCPIMTNDYNLNRVADLQGVTVLNINDLANAVKATYIPGEAMKIRVIQEGREEGQGVGYLEDGTMVVIEDGGDQVNNQVNATVTKTLQTSAGRMIFARINGRQ
jgi:uncharacterized protein YacL